MYRMSSVLVWFIFSLGLLGCSEEQGGSSQESIKATDIPDQVELKASDQSLSNLRPLKDNEKIARCVLKPNQYDGPCVFNTHSGGSFSISKRDQSPLYGDVSIVTVSIVSKGKAEVFGLTTYGNNSRWGSAVRSEQDRACWTGSDFEVCAY